MPIRDRSVFAHLVRCVLVLIFMQAWAAAQTRDAGSVKIGNFFQSSPCGIAWVVEGSCGVRVFDTGGLAYVAGTAAADEGYHLYRFAKDAAHVTFEWGRVGDNVVGRLSSDANTTLDLTLSSGWPNWPATFSAAADGASATAKSRSGGALGALHFADTESDLCNKSVCDRFTPQTPLSLRRRADGALPAFAESIDGTLETAQKRYEQTRPRAAGDGGDFVGAIADNMNNTRVYAADNHWVAHTVSRGWGKSPDGFPVFRMGQFLQRQSGGGG